MTRPRESYLLSPYRPPTSYPVTLTPDEATAWLAGYFALWHPAALHGLTRPPHLASAYDHDLPATAAIYVVPEGPHLYQPDDWPARVATAEGVQARATADVRETQQSLLAALRAAGASNTLLDLPADVARLFAGVGYGHLLVETLFDAADHEHLLDADGFWNDVTAAVTAAESGDVSGIRPHLVAAVDKLRAAREVLGSSKLRFLDLAILDRANLDAPWPASLAAGLPLTVLAAAETLERLAADFPERFAELKAKFVPDLPGSVDLACGAYREREDGLLPVESQWWNLQKARASATALLGTAPPVYGRKRSALHPHLPGYLKQAGYSSAIAVSLDGSSSPARSASVLNWNGPDGKTIDALGRDPHPADDPATFFNLAYHIHTATTGDSVPSVGIAHVGKPAAVGYAELIALCELGEALGEFAGVGRFLGDGHYGEYLGSASADDFVVDYLDDRVTNLHRPDPVSGFARHLRLRRRLDGAYALAALHRVLTPATDAEANEVAVLDSLEDATESRGADVGVESPDELEAKLMVAESEWAKKLADRVLACSQAGTPGFLVFNPCGVTRRATLELDGLPGPIPVDGAVKASEFANGAAKVVVEVPALGFAWIPRGVPGAAPPKARIKTAEGTTVRNEFFEAELDPGTGSLKAFRDTRTRMNRFGMQLAFNPGSKMRATSVAVTHAGAALGEVTATGDLLDEHNEILAGFRTRLRAWAGRPALELQIEFDLRHQPAGYPWHAYYGARFAWRDERAALFRGVHGENAKSSVTRPMSPDYLEVRLASERTFVFTGGLPFLQRHGTRMADVILIPEGETCRRFELLIAADRDYPMATATGWTAPVPVVPTDRGPPPGMASGWLGHVDLPSLLMTSLRPASGTERSAFARFVECAGYAGNADLRFARDPSTAAAVDGGGSDQHQLTLNQGAVPLEFSANEAIRICANWT